VVVDYAHKPEALQAVLVACRQIVGVRADGSPGQVIVVFGCGGDRDPFKRPVMGQIAASFADRVVLTSDNPRSEDPESILDAIVAGVPGEAAGRVERIEDRAEAIAAALGRAEAGDVVLIAGKGDEVYQIVGNVTLPFDDREVVVRTLIGGGAR
jgi:UDP-N-acetylmuramoyl-L-alanyl-D-glutamate--2,6-diaminopimelate ligase